MATFQFFFCRVGLRTYQHPCRTNFVAQIYAPSWFCLQKITQGRTVNETQQEIAEIISNTLYLF